MWLRNKKCCDIFGEKEEAFSLDGTLPHETPDQVSQYITREHDLLKQGKTLDIPEEEYVLGSGEKKLLHMIKVPITGTNGEPNMVITLAEDITQKKEQEKALIENKNFLQTLLDQVPVAIYSRGVDKKISYVNRKKRTPSISNAKTAFSTTEKWWNSPRSGTPPSAGIKSSCI